MGERKGQNKYYPPDFNYKIHKSLNAYKGVHALHERARKLDRGILIIRFEMPFNIWCDECNNHIGMGVRYNAEKKKIGMYHSTPIWRFRMKCHLCENHIELETDPKNMTYLVSSGGRRQELRWDGRNNEQIECQTEEHKQRMALDPMFMLEHKRKDAGTAVIERISVAELEKARRPMELDYELNSMARAKFRNEKSSLNDQNSTMLADDHEEDAKYVKYMMDLKRTTNNINFAETKKRTSGAAHFKRKMLKTQIEQQTEKIDSGIKRLSERSDKTNRLVPDYSSSSTE